MHSSINRCNTGFVYSYLVPCIFCFICNLSLRNVTRKINPWYDSLYQTDGSLYIAVAYGPAANIEDSFINCFVVKNRLIYELYYPVITWFSVQIKKSNFSQPSKTGTYMFYLLSFGILVLKLNLTFLPVLSLIHINLYLKTLH